MCISNGEGCGNFKDDSSQKIYRYLTGNCSEIRHYSYTKRSEQLDALAYQPFLLKKCQSTTT